MSETPKKLFPVTRVFADEKGESHFDTFHIEMKHQGDIGHLSTILPTTGIIFRETPSSYKFSWHTAPRRQFIVNLDADVEVTVSSGEKRVLKRGEVFFVEDIHGKGHFSQAVGEQVRHSLFMPVPNDFVVPDNKQF